MSDVVGTPPAPLPRGILIAIPSEGIDDLVSRIDGEVTGPNAWVHPVAFDSDLHSEFAQSSCAVQPDGHYSIWLAPGRYFFAIGKRSPLRSAKNGFPVKLYGWAEVTVTTAATQTIDIRYSGEGKQTTATVG